MRASKRTVPPLKARIFADPNTPLVLEKIAQRQASLMSVRNVHHISPPNTTDHRAIEQVVTCLVDLGYLTSEIGQKTGRHSNMRLTNAGWGEVSIPKPIWID